MRRNARPSKRTRPPGAPVALAVTRVRDRERVPGADAYRHHTPGTLKPVTHPSIRQERGGAGHSVKRTLDSSSRHNRGLLPGGPVETDWLWSDEGARQRSAGSRSAKCQEPLPRCGNRGADHPQILSRFTPGGALSAGATVGPVSHFQPRAGVVSLLLARLLILPILSTHPFPFSQARTNDYYSMGFRQRQRRRKRRAAQQGAAALSRRTGSSAAKWWLTIVSTKTCCARCGLILTVGAEMVYRHTPREALCLTCAEADQSVKSAYRPSLKWERARSR